MLRSPKAAEYTLCAHWQEEFIIVHGLYNPTGACVRVPDNDTG
jgi:hypothetical protein